MALAVFRVDASDVIGTGHVIRCMTLAGVLRAHGASVRFVCREHVGNLCALIEHQGFLVTRLPLAEHFRPAEGTAHAHWLGLSWQEDAEQTQAAIASLAAVPDWLIVDHYALDKRWESVLLGSVSALMIIDDLADREHCKGLLLDQNLVDRMGDRYEGKMPAGSALMLGPDFALLQPNYAELHARVGVRKGPINRLFVYFGGADTHDLTGRTLAAFLHLDRSGVVADVVVADDSAHASAIRRLVAGRENVRLHSGLPSLATLMAEADLAIGAGGVATWERLCVGLPALVVTVAENQRAIAEELDRRCLIRYLGHHDRVDESAIEFTLGQLLGRDSDEEWSRRCLAIVDGRGAARVDAVLTTTAVSPLCVRVADEGDENRLLEWRNDPITRQNAFSRDTISAATHRAWFRARLQQADSCRFYIVETDGGIPIGTVRFERCPPGWEVHFSLAPMFRGRGLGRRLVDAAMNRLRTDTMETTSIIGQVRDDNPASKRIFEALAFDIRPEAKAGVVVYIRAL